MGFCVGEHKKPNLTFVQDFVYANTNKGRLNNANSARALNAHTKIAYI